MGFKDIFKAIENSDTLKNFGKGMASAPTGSSVAARLGAGGGGVLAGKLKNDDEDDDTMATETDSPIDENPADMRRRRLIGQTLG